MCFCEGNLFSLKSKAHAQALQRDTVPSGPQVFSRFSFCCHKEELKSLLWQQYQWYFTAKNIARTEGEWWTCCTAANFREGVPRKRCFPWWSNIIFLSILPLLSSWESAIHREPWGNTENPGIPSLAKHAAYLGCSPAAGWLKWEFIMAKEWCHLPIQ